MSALLLLDRRALLSTQGSNGIPMLAAPAAGEVAQRLHGGVGDADRDDLPGLNVFVVQCGKNPGLSDRGVPTSRDDLPA